MCFACYIEKCLFNEVNNRYLNNRYILHLHNNSWMLTCANTSETFYSYCALNGSWENINCGQGNALTININDSLSNNICSIKEHDTTSRLSDSGTQTSSLNRATTKPLLSVSMAQITEDEHHNMPLDYNARKNYTATADNLTTILALSITPIGIAILLISTLISILLTRRRSKRHQYYSV